MPARKKTCELKAVDFFCGAGGMTYGMRSAGIHVIAGIDIDDRCRESYEINNPGSTFIHRDIKEMQPSELNNYIDIRRNSRKMIFIGCSPCQFWTHIHTNREKSRDNKNLLIDFIRFIDHFNPGYIVVENVPGLLTSDKENILSDFLEFLDNHRYVTDYRVLSFNNYGVPQSRTRFLLLASRIKKVHLPPEEHSSEMSVRNFIGVENDFSPISDGHRDDTDFIHTTASLSIKNKKRIQCTPKDGGTRMSWKNDPTLQIPTYKGKDRNFRDVYGRMFWDKPAPTITTKFHSLSNGRFGHPEEDRALSLREGATLQTFPRSYIFKGTAIADIARQIGNAVPPELAKRVGNAIINQ